MRGLTCLSIMLVLVVAASCSESERMALASPDISSAWGGWGGNGEGEPTWRLEGDAAASLDLWGPPPKPEKELDFEFKAPQASEHYVYIAATARDSLVRIDAESLDIRLIPVGGAPTVVATLPGKDAAVVINSGTDNISIVRSSPESDSVKNLDILPHANAIAVSPSGNHAIVYYNHELGFPGGPVGDFQTVAVVSLLEGKEEVALVSTGFHTSLVKFHEDGSKAYLVTDDGISVIELDEAKDGDITPIVAVSTDPQEDAELREVLITPKGDYALVRNLALPRLSIIDLAKENLVEVEVEGLPTDVDLIPGANKALVMLREQELAYILDLKAALAGQEALEELDISGSGAGAAVITSDGTRAILYSTVGESSAVAVLDLVKKNHPWKIYPLQKGAVGVAVSPKGSTALILHEKESYRAEASSIDKTIAGTQGFTLFNLATGYRKLVQTDYKWSDFLFVASKGKDLKAYVLTPDPNDILHSVWSVNLDTFIVDKLPLNSRPIAMVYVPVSGKVAVAQDHPNGRITFIDVKTGEAYSVTGYELNGLIH